MENNLLRQEITSALQFPGVDDNITNISRPKKRKILSMIERTSLGRGITHYVHLTEIVTCKTKRACDFHSKKITTDLFNTCFLARSSLTAVDVSFYLRIERLEQSKLVPPRSSRTSQQSACKALGKSPQPRGLELDKRIRTKLRRCCQSWVRQNHALAASYAYHRHFTTKQSLL